MDFLPSLRKKSLFLIIVVVVFYLIIAILSDINDLTINFQEMNYFLILPVLLVTLTGLFVKSIRQYFLLKQVKITISFKENLILYFAGLSLLSAPFGVGGIVKSHFLLKNQNESISKTTPVILIERFHDALAMFCIILFFVVITNFGLINIPLIVIGSTFMFLIIVLKNTRFTKKTVSKLIKIKFLKITNENSDDFYSSLTLLSKNNTLIVSWLIGLVGWLFDALAIYFSFLAFGLDLDFFITTIIGFSSILLGSLSFIPGGIGVTELSFVHLLSNYDVEISLISALIIFIRFTGIWFATSIGLISMKFVSK
jgi:uncharacterized protein (TIRG00374 family)|tara:strand:- start:1838 stop:2773 length:936 start_codon:yes stop_codon:yes gene_type:complete